MAEVSKKALIILGIVAAVILAILAFIGIMVGVSLKSLTTQERECVSKTRCNGRSNLTQCVCVYLVPLSKYVS